MGELIKPFTPKENKPLEIFGRKFSPVELIGDSLHNPDDKGWHFGAGEPEFWKYADSLVVPGGKMLDIGVEFGRNAFHFALKGMDVTGYDIDPNALSLVRRVTEEYDLPIALRQENVCTASLGVNMYDTILINQAFVHFPSKQAAFNIMQKAFDATKPGGYVWLRAAGKYDDNFEEYIQQATDPYSDVTQVSEDVFEAYCECSGELKLEPQLFFDPMEVLHFFAKKGMKITHTEIIPNKNHANIMFGQDWRQYVYKESWGFITVLAKK